MIGGGWKSIVGIGIEETERLERLHKRLNQISLLEQYGYTCEMAKTLCLEYNLLSPYYEHISKRQGCWFCPNSSIDELAILQTDYPELWQELLDLNNLYEQDGTQFVNQSFKYGMPFSKVIEQIDTINSQINLFDLIEEKSLTNKKQ